MTVDKRYINFWNRQFYSRIAQSYRASNAHLTNDRSFLQASTFLERHLRFQKTVLDIGCGTGRYFHVTSQRCELLVGIDLSRSMLEMARHPIGMEGSVKKFCLIEGDAFMLAFKDGVFGAVYSFGVLAEYIELCPDVLREIKRVLKPGGRVIFSAIADSSPSLRSTTVKRKIAEYVFASNLVLGSVKRYLNSRLSVRQFFETEVSLAEKISEVGFQLESLAFSRSESHHHFLLVAQKGH
jgi:ubiquinone/menaquinone biosynthesis C-methylase UbiE